MGKMPLSDRLEDDDTQNTEPRVCRVWLVRHAVTAWNQEQRFCGQIDVPLAEQGRVQAQWLAERLKIEKLAAIYTSDLIRARETTEAIVAEYPTRLPVHIVPSWREIDFGDWEGLTYAEVAQQDSPHLKFFTDPMQYSPPGGESFPNLVLRAQAAFYDLVQELIDAPPEGDVVVVSHGAILRVLLCSLLSIPFERQWSLRFDNASLSALDVVPTSADVMSSVRLALFNFCPWPQTVALSAK